MSKSRRIRKAGSSKAGRPKKGGDRYPSGKLKPPKPNARVLAARAALVGSDLNLHTAENPMDLALARGWITERQHRAGAAFAELRTRAGFASPCLSGVALPEVESGSGVEDVGWADMTDAQKTAVFDRAFSVRDPARRDAVQADAMKKWLALSSLMLRAEREEVELVCVHRSWPQWINQRVAGRFETSWERKRDLLVAGLDKVAKALFSRKAQSSMAPNRSPTEILQQPGTALGRPLAPKLNDVTQYVDQEGNQLLEVVRRVRGRRG